MKNLLALILLALCALAAQSAEPRRATGWKPDPKGGIHAYYNSHPDYKVTALKTRTDLSTLMPPIWDQCGLGACTAYGSAAAYWRAYWLTYGAAPAELSRLGLYWSERAHDGTTGTDAGSYIATGAWVLTNIGVGTSKTWPYTESRFQQKPPPAYFAEAAKMQALRAYKIDSSTSALRHTGIVTALSNDLPVVFGCYLYDNDLQDLTANRQFLPMPQKRAHVAGGHCMVIVGHDNDKEHQYGTFGASLKGFYIVRNSWGRGWGLEGFAWMPFAYIDSLKICDDFWVVPAAKK